MKFTKPMWVGAALVTIVLTIGIVKQCAAPGPDAIQQAAQQAASAIVTVDRADTALAAHRADSIVLVAAAKQNATLAAEVRDLRRAYDQVRRDVTVPPARILAAADTVIRADSTLLAAKDTIIATQGRDIVRLASSLQATRDTLATHRTVVIPASAVKSSFLSNLRLGKLVTVVVGYGAQYSGQRFTYGPQATVGVRLPL